MKKIVRAAVALCLVLALSCTAFAANSKTYNIESGSAKDASGNDVAVTLATTDTKPVTADVKTVMGSDYTADMAVVAVKEVSVPAGTTFPLTITFSVPGVTADTKGSLMHWTGSAWEKIPTTFGKDTMTGTFSSLSPVAFVVEADGTTAPKTGETNMIVAAGAVLAVAGIGAFLVTRKENA